MLYSGSCRYMYDYKWYFFPGRLHSTREIIYFLENIENIHEVLVNNPGFENLIFGDIYHNDVIPYTKKFLNHKMVLHDIRKLVLEISSRNVCYYNDLPLSEYYTTTREHNHPKNNIQYVELSDDEIESDIQRIIHLARSIFNEDIEIHVIPHLNLKIKSTNEYIPKRNAFVTTLECICAKLQIQFHNIGKYLETICNSPIFIEDYMNDSTHYSLGYHHVKKYLENRIYDNI